MPDVFERYFADFVGGEQEMNLVRLDPSYTVWRTTAPLKFLPDWTLGGGLRIHRTGAGDKLRASWPKPR